MFLWPHPDIKWTLKGSQTCDWENTDHGATHPESIWACGTLPFNITQHCCSSCVGVLYTVAAVPLCARDPTLYGICSEEKPCHNI